MLLRNRFVHLVLTTGLALAFATPVAAGTVYSWLTEDGTYAYADSLKGVPKAYRATAKSAQMGQLKSYARYTPSDRAAKGSYSDRLAGNLERLRGNAEASSLVVAASHQAPSMHIRTGRSGDAIEVPLTGEGAVEIEKVRTQLKGEIATRHYTIARQGGVVIAVYKGESNSRPIVEVDPSELFDVR